MNHSSEIWRSPLLSADGRLSHGFPTRQFGQLCAGNGMTPEILSNRARLAQQGGFELSSMTIVKQSHSSRVVVVSQETAGNGASGSLENLPDADGLVTNLRGVSLVVRSNDCVPILLYDPRTLVVGALHAGWKGVIGNIAPNAVAAMQSTFTCMTRDLIAVLGPSIRGCHYDISTCTDNRISLFKEAYPSHPSVIVERHGKTFLDLASAVRAQLVACGLSDDRIDTCPDCTFEMSDKWPSRRANDGKPVGIATWSFIALTGNCSKNSSSSP